MTDSEYKVHFTFWAAMKSPLIMGTDIRSLDAAAYSIYTNPAILALSQDPAGSAAARIWRYYVPGDMYGPGEIQLWAGALANGDFVVLLLNTSPNAMMLNATLAEVFVNTGVGSGYAKQSWDVYDLWANRMPNATAQMILNSNSTMGVANATSYYYNSTQTSYKEGIMANHTLLMGTKVGSVAALGTVQAMVQAHDVVAYRMRPQGAAVYKRDEL